MCDVLTAGGAVARGPLSVLKFGSSLLDGSAGVRTVVAEIRRELATGHRVLTVVSALRGTTDRLLEAATSVSPEPARGLLSSLLKTGEDASVALLTIALTEVGVHAHAVSSDALGLRTVGPLDDAEPVEVDVITLAGWLRSHEVVVVPGFVGRDSGGVPSLLGRGGSDLTALFLGDRLGAEEVRLVKDVDGVHDRDPRGSFSPGTPFDRVDWDTVRRVGNGVVQDKALRFAEDRRLAFRVAAPGGKGTRVGSEVRS